MTRVQVIRKALRLIGALAPGEPVDAAAETDAAETLQMRLDTWGSERLTFHEVRRAVFDLQDGKGTPDEGSFPDNPYTIGPGGDFDIDFWPVWIEGASVISLNNPDQPLELPIQIMNRQQYQQAIPVKQVGSTLIQGIYYVKTYTTPGLGAIYVWPFINTLPVQIALYLPVPVTGFTSAASNYIFPPGYAEAIVYQLAIRLAPEWDLKVSPEVDRQAREYFANLQRTNVNMDTLSADSGLLWYRGAAYNWKSDTPA
jgi:hypothetical protein